MPYADEYEEGVARKLGYVVERNANRGSSFHQGTRHVWSCMRGYRSTWQTADIINEYYRGHLMFDDLIEALERPLLK